MTDAIDDLEAEQDALAAVLGDLSPTAWSSTSAAAGWSVADVVLHLAQTEEAVTASIAGGPDATGWNRFGATVDAAMAALVEAERAPGLVVFGRWQAARRAAVRALRQADPDHPGAVGDWEPEAADPGHDPARRALGPCA